MRTGQLDAGLPIDLGNGMLVHTHELVQNMKRNDTSTVKSLDRGLDILEYIATTRNSPSFSQLLRDLDIPRSSLFHLLSNLQLRGFLAREPTTEGYRLGPNLAKLAKAAPQPSLGTTVSPFLQQLSAELNETCGFYVHVGDSVEVVASAISTQALSYTMKVGARAPLYAVSTGKIVLAQMESDLLKQYLIRVALTPVTPQTIRSKSRLVREIRSVKASGFAYSHEEFTCGITAVATGVHSQGRFIGALNVAVPTVRFTPDRAAAFRDALRMITRAITQALE
jgi:IclR family transcriptional regulator, acetate operon repressor